MARYYAKTPRVLSEDIYRFIARNTSLTISQVKEVFDCYEDLIKEVVKSKGRTNDLIIQLPKVGHFYFIKKKGRKKGSVVKLPDPKQDYKEFMYIVAEEDQPNYESLSFKVSPYIQSLLREVSSTYE